jgi:hypothetical protein
MDTRFWMDNKKINSDFGRSGDCDFKKCKAACCRFVLIGKCEDDEQRTYLEGFGFSTIIQNGVEKIILKKDCKYLDLKTFKCKKQNKKSICCHQFPLPQDGTYQKIEKLCSYKFKDGKIKTMGLNS